MAYTSLEEIHRPTGKALNYFLNPDKTDDGRYVSGYNCTPEFADIEWDMTEALSRQARGDYSRVGGANVRAYSALQAFSFRDGLTPEQVHELGRQLADEWLEGKHEYVIATHIDHAKKQIHNHIIFNATSFYDLKKFRSEKKGASYFKMREISDRICKEHGLDVINPKNQKTAKTNWAEQKRKSFREIIAETIDEVILISEDYEDFKKQLSEQGISIKEGQYLSFHHKDMAPNKSLRASRNGILSKYTKAYTMSEISHVKNNDGRTYARRIEIESVYTKLARTHELFETLRTIRAEKINGFEEFALRESSLEELAVDAQYRIKSLQAKVEEFNTSAKLLQAFSETLPLVAQVSRLEGDEVESFIEENSRALRTHEIALQELEKRGISTAVDYEKVLELAAEQSAAAAAIEKTLAEIKARVKAVQNAESVVRRIVEERESLIRTPETGKYRSGR